MRSATILDQLASARRIADHAGRLGIERSQISTRPPYGHMGAALADSVLQAGVSYKTVVRMRVERIISNFPETATLSGLTSLIERRGVADFLLWSHPTKVSRFVSLAQLLSAQCIETTFDLHRWLCGNEARHLMLRIHGIGPKTHDYLCCLVGIDCIAVDRHIKSFASEAGVVVSDYDGLKTVVSYAADLLGMARRDFDAWIWRTIATRDSNDRQLVLI